MEKEGRDHLSFPAACGMALQACPWQNHGVLMGPLQLLMDNMSLATLLNIPSQVPSTREKSNLVVSHATNPVAPRPSLVTKQQDPSPDQLVSPPWSGDEAIGTLRATSPKTERQDTFQESLKRELVRSL